MNKNRELLTLAQVRAEYEKDNAPLKQNVAPKSYCTIGLVVDCSNVFKYEAGRDYTQKFKIIDASNHTDPVQVVIWSNRKEDFLLNVRVGDILFLNSYRADVFKESLQLKRVFKDEESYFRLFSGNTELTNYNSIDKKIGLDDESGKLLNTIMELRKFSSNYFTVNKVPVFVKDAGKDSKGKVSGKTSSDFDLILRVVGWEQVGTYYRIKLTNEEVQYYINYTRKVDPGVYKVRSVASTQWLQDGCSLTGNDYTFFLQIASWMKSYDSKQWDKLVPGSSLGKKKAIRPRIGSKIRLDKEAAKKTEKLTLKELIAKDDHTQDVIVRCEVMDVLTTFEQSLKKFDSDNHIEKAFTQEKGVYIYSIHLLITDQSLNGEVMNVYIYTYDKQGLEFLPELSPEQIYGRNTLAMKEHYDNFVNRLVEESDFKETPLDIVLSPLFNGKQTIYRIVRTELLF